MARGDQLLKLFLQASNRSGKDRDYLSFHGFEGQNANFISRHTSPHFICDPSTGRLRIVPPTEKFQSSMPLVVRHVRNTVTQGESCLAAYVDAVEAVTKIARGDQGMPSASEKIRLMRSYEKAERRKRRQKQGDFHQT